jgi:TolB-like protein/class 3 adenylate cyclase/Flp pilus assembly protein TadD
MSTEIKKEIQLEIAHVLFIDIVGYSKLSINQQRAVVNELTEVVSASDQFQKAEAAERLIKIPTGDGMALVFYNSPEAPAQCAIEVSRILKEHPRLQLRMGVHSGPVSGVIDVNGHANLAGAGLNIAQRVMVCGDAGHILLSKHVAEDLEEYEQWRPLLHDLGSCEVKHGVRVSVVNLYDDQFGNAKLPRRFETVQKRRARLRCAAMTTAFLALAAIVAGIVMFSRYRVRSTLAVPEKSIAVLPFENRSEDKANAYFADGIQDEILTRLSKIADLKVISRTSTQHYQSKPGNLTEIAKQLGVANILEGSVQKAADHVRVNVQLVNAQTDSHLWADTYDRKLTDIFGVESEIAKAIAESLQAKLTGREEQELAVKPTNNPEAYDAYLRGLAFQARFSFSFNSRDLGRKAVSFFELAVQLDPNFALAWARLSRADAMLYFVRSDTAEAAEVARSDAVKRALENAQKLEPNSPETLLALGYYQFWVLQDYGLAKTTFSRVSKLLPGSSEVPYALARVTQYEGHPDQSIGYYEQALALDPRNVEVLNDTAWTYATLRQLPAALKIYDRVLDVTPNDPNMMAAKAGIYQAQGNLQEAARSLPEIDWPFFPWHTFVTKMTQLRLERKYGELIRLLQTRLAQFHFDLETDRASDQVWLALTQRLAGDTAGANVSAEQARNTFEEVFRDRPDHLLRLEGLSKAHALMGKKELAIKEAERAVMLVPRAKDPQAVPSLEENMAVIQTILGENSRAISTVTRLLQTPYDSPMYPFALTPALLRLDPIWDPLRADPAFQKLCEEKQP